MDSIIKAVREEKRKINGRIRGPFSGGKGTVLNAQSDKQRRRAQSMIFRLQAIAGIKKTPMFKMINFVNSPCRLRRYKSVESYLGQAYVGKPTIQISLECTQWSDKRLYHVVAHELGHAWLALSHSEDCKLMGKFVPEESELLSMDEMDNYFKTLVEKFNESTK